MQTSSQRIVVQKIVSGRYPENIRPTRWDDRASGVETVLTTSGEEVLLFSNGGQSTPEEGWEILLMDAVTIPDSNSTARAWTLYGIKNLQ